MFFFSLEHCIIYVTSPIVDKSRFISSGWLALSPDLTFCDFYLWGYLKSLIYVNRLRSLQDLKTKIREWIANICILLCSRWWGSCSSWQTQYICVFCVCMDKGGLHLSDDLKKKKLCKQNFTCVLLQCERKRQFLWSIKLVLLPSGKKSYVITPCRWTNIDHRFN